MHCGDKIINLLSGRAKCAYDKIKNLDLFIKTIDGFDKDAEYNLVIANGVLSQCGNRGAVIACTEGDFIDPQTSAELVYIWVIDDKIPTLEMAATLLYEGMHAEMFRYVNRFKRGVDPNDRPRLLQLYQYYKGLTQKKI